mmetsp:Transcript_22359/g.72098  ORF Transcript_22359/g.72098 Transcript_22359/m.72098 type:complete len:443 (+) Transcript_22359:63-1391(+)
MASTTTTTTTIRDCPAFQRHFADGEKLNELVGKCPAFEGGCPFKRVETASQLELALADVPRSHSEDGPARAALVEVLGAHQACPVLSEAFDGWWLPYDQQDGGGKENRTTTTGGKKSSTSFKKRSASTSSAKTLSAMLKEGTEAVHAEAEGVEFVKALLERRAPLQSYVALIARLAKVYEVMEAAMDDAERLRGATFFADELRRTPSLRKDLAFYKEYVRKLRGGGGFCDKDKDESWAEAFREDSPATDAYVERLRELRERKQDDLLAAHVYTRYLGDLSGGQVLKRAVKRGLLGNGDSDDGLLFYNFDDTIGPPTQVKKFKDKYRKTLDSTPLANPVDDLVQEAVAAFRHNTALLAELDAFLTPAKKRPPPKNTQGKTCPFLAGVDVSKLPPDAFHHHHPAPTKGIVVEKTKKCPFAGFGTRDVLVVALLAVAFSALPYLL